MWLHTVTAALCSDAEGAQHRSQAIVWTLIRVSPQLSAFEVARPSPNDGWKWAACDLFHGGAKAGTRGDPNGADKEQILRAFARALANEVPSDMGLAEQDVPRRRG